MMSYYTEGVAPSGISAAQDGTTITVTWTPPSPAPSAGYMVYYSTIGDEGSVSVSSGSDSQVVITGLHADRAYTVSVVAVFDLPSVQTAAAPAVRPGTQKDQIYSIVSVLPLLLPQMCVCALHAFLQFPMLSSMVECCPTTVLWWSLTLLLMQQ